MSQSFELPTPEHFTCGTVGVPGERVFYIQVRQGRRLVTLKSEKEQVRALGQYLAEVLDKLPAGSGVKLPDIALVEPIEPAWPIASIGLGYDEDTKRIVIVATAVEEEEGAEVPTAKFAVTGEQAEDAGLPVDGSDTRDYVVRNLVGLDPARKLVAIAQPVRPGAQVVFCRRDRGTASDDLVRMLDSVKTGLYRPPRGALYFSCLGRGASLFGEGSEELRMIADGLGDVPLVGFFCNGEISHNRLYGYTGVLTLFL